MKKVLTMLLAVVLLGAAAMTQTPQEVERIRKASCQVRVTAVFPEQSIQVEANGKKFTIKRKPRRSSSGSGTIVGRSLTNDKKKPKYMYWVMTAAHVFPPNFKKAEKSAIWLHFYSYNGAKDFQIEPGAKFWVNPSFMNRGVDVAFIGFYSNKELPIIQVERKLKRNLFGVKYIAIGHPFAITPFIREGRFTTNHPTDTFGMDRVGASSAFAPGMSGGGVFIERDGKLYVAGVITAWIGNDKYPERFGCITRVDAILATIAKYNMKHLVEIK